MDQVPYYPVDCALTSMLHTAAGTGGEPVGTQTSCSQKRVPSVNPVAGLTSPVITEPCCHGTGYTRPDDSLLSVPVHGRRSRLPSEKYRRMTGIECKEKFLFSAESARSRIPDNKLDAKTLKFFLDFQTKSDLRLFGTQHK